MYPLGGENFKHLLDHIDGCSEYMNEATKRVHVNFLDFFGKLDSHAFQDWLMLLGDYFDWFGMTNDRKV